MSHMQVRFPKAADFGILAVAAVGDDLHREALFGNANKVFKLGQSYRIAG